MKVETENNLLFRLLGSVNEMKQVLKTLYHRNDCIYFSFFYNNIKTLPLVGKHNKFNFKYLSYLIK